MGAGRAPTRTAGEAAAAGVAAGRQPGSALPDARSSRGGGQGGSRRRTLLIVLGLLAVVVLALVLATRGGSSGHKATTQSASQTNEGPQTTQTVSHHKASSKAPAKSAKATPPAETSVVVLNGTETTGLATRISSELQQTGYSQAAAKFGRPPGANEVTVVEYAGGHQPDAAQVARSLSVSHVEPMEQAVAVLAGSAKVVVIVGADKATQTTTAP